MRVGAIENGDGKQTCKTVQEELFMQQAAGLVSGQPFALNGLLETMKTPE
jgi:hypothetical protein